MIIQNNISFRALVAFGCFLVYGVSGCQTSPSGPGNPMFSSPMFTPSATIPPPATGSYTVGDALAYANPGSGQNYPPQQPQPSYPPPGPNEGNNNDYDRDSDGAHPFRNPDRPPHSASATPPPVVPAVKDTSSGQWTQADSQPSAQPFQSRQYAGSVAPGSALMSAPEVPEPVEIPASAYRTDSGMRVSSEAALANTRGSSSVTQTAYVAPAATRTLPGSQSPELTQPGPVYADKVE